MYQALYRKWRPRTFDDVVGQEHVTETLKNQIAAERLSHAYLFVGTRGTGKTSCAKILARAVNCENPVNGNPCNNCKSCIGIEDGSILDVVELDAASNNGVDNVRALRDEAVFSPAVVKKRVYIIDEVHMLSSSAFNALLKILEEPPEHLMFILATTELHKVPATILSRCQRHSFKRIANDAIAKRLEYVAQQENLHMEFKAAQLLARLADGSLRDGLSLLDQCSGNELITADTVLSSMGLAGNLRTIRLLTTISNGETEEALSLFGEMWRDGKAPATLLTELCSLLRDVLMIKVAPKGGLELLSGGFDIETLRAFAKDLSAEQIIADIDSIQARVGALRDGRDPKTAAELCIIGLCEPDLGDGIDCLRARVARLEEALGNGGLQASAGNAGLTKKHCIFPGNETEKTVEPMVKAPSLETHDKLKKLSQQDTLPAQPHRGIPPLEPDNNSAPSLEFTPEPPEQRAEKSIPHEEQYRPEQPLPDEPVPPEPDKQLSADKSIWKDIQEQLKNTMPVFLFVLLSEATGEMCDGALVISVAGAFHQTQLEQTAPQEFIRAAIQNVLGRTVPVKIVVNKGTQAANTAKLNDLSKFGNVKFE